MLQERKTNQSEVEKSALGKETTYTQYYSPDLLYPISRGMGREKIDLLTLPFEGVDYWTAYEISWLNLKGKPEIALADFAFCCKSLNIIESKSFKLYLNSFNQSAFNSLDSVKETMKKDLEKVTQGEVIVGLYSVKEFKERKLGRFEGLLLDELDIETNVYQVEPNFLRIEDCEKGNVEEIIYSDLLKSNCLATGQPDWGSLYIRYEGQKISHEGLLKYIISYRNHSGFAEHCVEQIFQDIKMRCKPEKLTVFARYTRRGGLDINPFRSDFEKAPKNSPQIRQ